MSLSPIPLALAWGWTGSWPGKGTASVIALELAPVKYLLPLILSSLVASPNEAQGITKQSAFV